MTVLTSKIFWIRSLERAIKTFIQTLLALVGDAATVNVIGADFKQALIASATTTVLSFLTSLASSLKGDSESPSLVEEKIEQQIVEKIEEGEVVGDPPVIFEPVEEEVMPEAEPEVELEVVEQTWTPTMQKRPRRLRKKKVAE